ncbi:MAG TPA: M28 family peptidase [Bacteroidia bacterium]|nr:M28 family peptidase [Bacteroidia bacterium]
MKRIILSLLLVSALSGLLTAQTPDTVLLKKHISTLASDAFEGRETGTKGEQLAYEYIINQFKEVGLEPAGTDGYLQPFPFNAGSYMGKKCSLKIDGKTLTAGTDFYPLGYSANKSFEGKTVFVGHGIAAPSMDDYAGLKDLKEKIFVMESGYPADFDPHSKNAEYADMRTRIDSAIAKGALAVIFVNTDKDTEDPSSKYTNRISPSELAVVFVSGKQGAQLASGKQLKVQGETEILKNERTGHNILGKIDNKAANTIVIGAHYDHLGYGIEGSLYRGEKAIHNGADDNASGTAAVIEFARLLKNSPYKNNNYLFIAFSGEEMGLLGSNFLMKSMLIPPASVNFMFNMDMVGRLKPEEPVLIINGTGTSPEWDKAIAATKIDEMSVKTTESGVGPSDHTSFYLKDIPVLHFFSGTHADYHKPSDDEDKINYLGEMHIMQYMMNLIAFMNDKGKIAFTKTDDSKNEDAPRFKVTLGVVPDYAFEGEGMRIDGISDGKPAQKAGLLSGDIVIQIGENHVTDMMSYMKALSKFNKGDKATVIVKRGNEEVSSEVEF